jgi:uncharacterized membrane protein (UPF0127 family)
MMPLARYAAILSLLCATAACATGSGDDRWVEVKGKRFTVEVADDDAERARGLMFRDQMAADQGMLFIHDQEAPQAYWMKNTRIPLDIFYFDATRKLVSVQRRVPPCSLGDQCPPFPSDGPALYVLELNAGLADELGVKPGDTMVFGPGIAPGP